MASRREFIGLTAGALAAAPLLGMAAGAETSVTRAARPVSILVLGGTGFLGPHQIEYAVARGHRVTMFNRGSNPGMFGDVVEELIGNRDRKIDNGLAVLEGDRSWDVVIDNSGYVPRHVRDSAELLKGRVAATSTSPPWPFTTSTWPTGLPSRPNWPNCQIHPWKKSPAKPMAP